MNLAGNSAKLSRRSRKSNHVRPFASENGHIGIHHQSGIEELFSSEKATKDAATSSKNTTKSRRRNRKPKNPRPLIDHGTQQVNASENATKPNEKVPPERDTIPTINPGKSRQRNRKAGKTRNAIDENDCIQLQREIQAFLLSEETTKIMSNSLTKDQRAYIHKQVPKMGLMSRSHGKGADRCLTIYKPVNQTSIETNIECILTDQAQSLVTKLKSSLNLSALFNHENSTSETSRMVTQPGLTVSNITHKLIPRPSIKSNKVITDRSALPIFQYRSEIVQTIATDQVVIISGETGSGKSTQVPQYIIEEATIAKVPCRIVCTQPRRIAAISIAERVAYERSEKVGNTVGYQIRLENNFKPTTNLIYATSGCFIRALMSDASRAFHGVTHLIVDEIHERDKNTDFLLIALRDELARNKKLKVILMSATMNIGLLCGYFHGCHVIKVPGRCFETRTFFLEDILFFLKYETAEMRNYLKIMSESESSKDRRSLPNAEEHITQELDEETRKFVDDLITSCREQADDLASELFEQLIYLIEGEGLPVDVRHSTNLCTPLIAAAIRNNLKYLHRFLEKGADPYKTDIWSRNAFDYASMHENSACLDRLNKAFRQDESDNNSKRILLAYQRQFSNEYDDEIDHKLLLTLLLTINQADSLGSILVFLPGYNDMITQKEMIESEFAYESYKLFLIHSTMSMHDQRMAFKPANVRKIILATNIAETSITFPDVSYVVDTGYVKQYVYDSTTCSSYLKSVPISKACAKQRAGRAGRTQTGICYRLYSSAKYEAMSEFAIPEFLRIPLMEVCLYAKEINERASIVEYLSKALEPPSKVSILNAIQKLTMLGALDKDENMTILGKRLVNMPVDVQMGKCLLYAILFRCLDPVLIIAAYYSVKDPFLLPSDRSERGRIDRIRKELCENVISDHLGIIRLYQKWRTSLRLQTESRFLIDYNLSKSSLEMMCAVQNHISDYIKRTALPNGVKYNVLNANSNDWNIIRACLSAGLYPNVAHVDRIKGKIRTQYEKSVVFHPSSVLKQSTRKNEKVALDTITTDWILFTEKSRFGRMAFLRYNTIVTPLNIAIFCGGLNSTMMNGEDEVDEDINLASHEDSDQFLNDDDEEVDEDDDANQANFKLFVVDEWITFHLQKSEYYALTQLKEICQNTFIEFLSSGRNWEPNQYSKFLDTLKQILHFDNIEQFGDISQPFDDSYLPRRYDTMMNMKHFRMDRNSK